MRLIKRKIYSEQLRRHAILYIGIPDAYEKSNQSYPVLYMQDGHNVFLKEDSFMGETWKILDLYESNSDLKDIIVVAINASEKDDGRMNEYSPFKFSYPKTNPKFVGGDGDNYLDYLIHTIKPMIDSEFRTLKDRENTGIMGSSLGGYISLYAGIKHPDVFGKIASLSGAFFVALNPLLDAINKSRLDEPILIYLDTGDKEGAAEYHNEYLQSNQQIYDCLIKKCNKNQIIYKVIEGGRHSEIDWAKRLKSILLLLY